MANIIKRRKTSQYTQINNLPIQEDLGDLAAIGLLTYIMSLPEDWVLHKTQLQSTFSRKRVDSAWKVLVEKKYIIGMTCHVSGYKNTYYVVSDLPFTQDDYDSFILETIEALIEDGKNVTNVLQISDQTFDIEGFYSNVQNVHYIPNCRKSVYTKEIKTKETKQKNINKLSIDNYQEAPPKIESEPLKEKEPLNDVQAFESNEPIKDVEKFSKRLTDVANDFYTEFSVGRWNKQTWNELISRFVVETISSNRFLNIPENKLKGYAYVSIKNMAAHHDYKNSEEFAKYEEAMYEWTRLEKASNQNTGFYNWLDESN